MPTPAYMSISGAKQGPITKGNFTAESVGNIYQEGHEDEILVQGFEHTVELPKDPQAGQPSGQRKHGAVKITKIFDKSSPLLYNALTSGEKLPTVTINWYRTNANGAQEHYFTHKLTDAIITKIEAKMPNCQNPENAHFTHLEEVEMTYRAIDWTHEVAGTSGADDWRKPVAAA